MAKKVYLKLGEKAVSFFDPLSRLKITKGKVVETDAPIKSPKVLKALKHGHLEKATEDEFVKNLKSVEPPSGPIIEEKSLEFFEAMKKEEIIAWAENFGFNEDDMIALKTLKKAEMPKFMVDTIPDYEDEGEGKADESDTQ